MNIIIVHQWFKESATFKHIVYFANELVKQGHKVLVVSHKDEGNPYNISSEILFSFVTCKMTFNKLERSFEKEIQAFKPDIVHSFCNQYVSYIGLLIKKSTGGKLIVHYEDNHESIFFNKIGFSKFIKLLLSGLFYLDIWVGYNLLLEVRIRKHVDAFDVLTEPLLKMLQEKKIDKPIKVIYPPIDLNFFKPQNNGLKLKQELGLENSFLLVHSGTIYCHWLKGYDKFLHAISIAKQKIPEIKILFTGRKVGNADNLMKIINKYSLSDTIIDKGYVENFSDIPAFLSMADILFEPQTLKVFDEYRLPSKLHNYMACGKAIITFNNGFCASLTDEEIIKIDFDNENAKSISNKIIALYNNPEFRLILGNNARKKAEKLFNKEKSTRQLIEFYNEVLHQEKCC